jgi:hypothetical protein
MMESCEDRLEFLGLAPIVVFRLLHERRCRLWLHRAGRAARLWQGGIFDLTLRVFPVVIPVVVVIVKDVRRWIIRNDRSRCLARR